MNFLDLCKAVAQEVNLSGGPDAFTTTVGVTGGQRRVRDWVNRAYENIQNKHAQWQFLRSSFTVNATVGVSTFAYGACVDTKASAPISAFRDWIKDSFRIYDNALGLADQGRLPYMGYDAFRDRYLIGVVQQMRPSVVTIDPAKAFELGWGPDKTYVVTGDYYKAATLLALDADVPVLPVQHHMTIVWRAIERYGRFEAAPEVYQDAKNNWKETLAQLELDQLPPMEPGAPLA